MNISLQSNIQPDHHAQHGRRERKTAGRQPKSTSKPSSQTPKLVQNCIRAPSLVLLLSRAAHFTTDCSIWIRLQFGPRSPDNMYMHISSFLLFERSELTFRQFQNFGLFAESSKRSMQQTTPCIATIRVHQMKQVLLHGHTCSNVRLLTFPCTERLELIFTALYFNASKEELLADGASLETSVQVKGGGYIAALGVYHEIHCLVGQIVSLTLISLTED
jgi:hypothetical protein